VRAFSAALVVAAIALVGCGGDDGDGDEAAGEPPAVQTAPEGPSKGETVSRADAICGQAKVAIDMARTRFHHGNFDQASPAELEQFVLDRIVPVYENEVSSLRKLPVPAGDEKEFEEILSAAERANEALAVDPEQIAPNGGSPLYDEANRLAGAYGLSVCIAP
jgi:hypothetical protein